MHPDRLDTYLDDLVACPLAWFRDWPNRDVPSVAAGVYTIWMDGALVYAGMAGRGLTREREAHHLMLGGKPTGLFTRLASHAAGRRSGDQFCVYVCDRLVVPDLSLDDLQALREGERFLDRRTRDYIHRWLTYRFSVTADGADAFAVETAVRRGALAAGKPLLNPL